MNFRLNDIHYQIHLLDVEIYPQGISAIAENLHQYEGENILADIGNGTMNFLFKLANDFLFYADEKIETLFKRHLDHWNLVNRWISQEEKDRYSEAAKGAAAMSRPREFI